MCNLALKTLYFSLLISFLHLFHRPTSASPLYHRCSSSTYTLNSTYRTNLNLLLSSLSSKASANNGFYNTTIGENQDQAYGLALCRADMSSDYCQKCLDEASGEITKQENCPSNRSGIIWYDNCTLHYSDQAFFGQVHVSEEVLIMWNTQNTTQPDDPNVDVRALMYPLIATAPSQTLMFAADGSDAKGYGLVQCTRDLSVANCKTCLSVMMNQLLKCCEGKRGWRILGSSCMVRYEAYMFFSSPALPPVVPPAVPPDEARKKRVMSTTAIILISTGAFLLMAVTVSCLYCYVRGRNNQEIVKVEINSVGSTSSKTALHDDDQEIKIVTGKRNSRFNIMEEAQSLLTYAWQLWSSNQGLELIDPLIVGSCPIDEALRYIHIGLLCVQEDAADRPTMSLVVLMLGSEYAALPEPRKPAFYAGKVVSTSGGSSTMEIDMSN
ncbi:hypothetical protein MRB53_021316 [Persea americana]|uniref:Uncharacterized protein n=1 Tax=Persea americana TaxID=3435 RepID=A0ACC2L3J3_PERAE|nr:hypothetical protein MRB53_021316 [Persea americana]